ncbi:MAG: glycoside hydrolase family 37 [Ruminococcaceae bacterium]|nr:glycoside hydrolase family 37 [Oscillospiraceae bacterium]
MNNYNLILNYAKANYKKMFREPDGILSHKFIVPGATYSNSLWDWDCWLTNIALRSFTEEDISEYEKGCVINFLEHMDEDGKIPIYITPTMEWYNFDGSFPSNIHKPCLAQHAEFIVKTNNDDVEWLRPYFDKILKFIDYYYNNQRHSSGLYYWINDCAIGVDNDPSTYYRPENSSASIYLNCLMYKELTAVCYLGNLLNIDVSFYEKEAENLLKTVRDLCFDEKDGMYYSADLNLLPVDPDSKLHSGAPRHWDTLIQRIGCWSGFMAMWAGIATPEQAQRMVKENLLDEKGFWAPYGVRTLSKYEKMYRIVKSGNPSCWLGPIWGISNYMVFDGLLKYGFIEEAKELAEKSVRLFAQDIEKTGELHEYYDPESGEPINNPGFQNWNLLSIKMGIWLNNQQ